MHDWIVNRINGQKPIEPGYSQRMDWAAALAERMVATVHGQRPSRPSSWTLIVTVAAVAVGIAELIAGLQGPVGAGLLILTAAIAFIWRHARAGFAAVVLSASPLIVDIFAAVTGRPIETPAAAGVLAMCTLYGLARHAPAKIVPPLALIAVLVQPLVANLNPAFDGHVAWMAVDMLGPAVLIGVALVLRASAATRHQGAVLAETNERNRLANDIHDSVAHHMSAIAIRAESALQHEPNAALEDALRTIKKSASTGLADMRHLVNEIRQHAPMDRPLPGLGDVRQLAAESTTAHLGIVTNIEVDAEILPVTTSTAAYAICREAITNIIRHATNATEAILTIRDIGPTISITVADNGMTPITAITNGHGLTSMNQRAQAIGGTLTAGPNPTGGWVVVAQLPTSGQMSPTP